jgi:hypothetical protein
LERDTRCEELRRERVAQILEPDRAEIGSLSDAPPRPSAKGVIVHAI